MRGAHEDTPFQHNRRRIRRHGEGAGLAEQLRRLHDRWARDFSTRIEEYTIFSDGAANDPQRRARDRFELTQHRVALPSLPESFDGLRIVQLTDIHHGLYLPLHAVMDAVEIVNRLSPDVVALTGDFVSYSRSYIDPVAEILGRIRAKHGVFAVLGNHDFRVGAELIARALRHEGVDVLRNRHTMIRSHGETVAVAGIDDLYYRADLARALHGVHHGTPVVLLSHNPKIIRRAAQLRIDLVLSGHTHGGQVRLPVVSGLLSRREERKRFAAGWDSLGATKIYVSRGIGTIVVPVRYRCPAEIPQFHLYSRPVPPVHHS